MRNTNPEILQKEAEPRIFSLVLPCRNEEEAIIPVLDLALEVCKTLLLETDLNEVEIILVDDCSDDMTAHFLQQFAKEVKIIRLGRNFGYGGALKRGFEEARGEYIGFYDVDYTYDPYALVELYRKLQSENLDMVCGDRLHSLDNMPFIRCVGNFFFRTIIRRLFGQQVEDSCTGQRVFRAKYIPVMIKLLPDQLDFSLSMTLMFLHFRLPFTEIPVRYSRRIGSSKLRVLNDGLRFFSTIICYWVRFRYKGCEVRKMLPQVER